MNLVSSYGPSTTIETATAGGHTPPSSPALLFRARQAPRQSMASRLSMDLALNPYEPEVRDFAYHLSTQADKRCVLPKHQVQLSRKETLSAYLSLLWHPVRNTREARIGRKVQRASDRNVASRRVYGEELLRSRINRDRLYNT